MIFPQTITIGGQTFLALRRPMFQIREISRPPLSYAFGCPKCGDLWARVSILGRSWQFLAQPCESCRDPLLPTFMVPGSILLSWDLGFNDSLGENLWRRELALHIRHYEKIGELG